MTDPKNPGDKTLTMSPPKTLTLKRPVEQNTVKQRFSHGRSKAVVVEVKRRISGPGDGGSQHSVPPPRPVQPVAPTAPPVQKAAPPISPPRPAAGIVLRTLSVDEQDARTRALADSRSRESEIRRQADEEASIRAQRDERERSERERIEREAAAARSREEEDNRRAEEDARRRVPDLAARRVSEEAAPVRSSQPPAGPGGSWPEEDGEKRRTAILCQNYAAWLSRAL